jgi:hypothetical protein
MHLHVYDSFVFKNESPEQVGLATILQTYIQTYSILVLGRDTGYSVGFCDFP